MELLVRLGCNLNPRSGEREGETEGEDTDMGGGGGKEWKGREKVMSAEIRK